MPFDIKTAKPDFDIKTAKAGFDISTAQPINAAEKKSFMGTILGAVFNPLPKTLYGKSPSEITEPRAAQMAAQGSPIKSFLTGFGADVADVATTPATYIPVPGAKLLGKIPVAGTTAGKIAKTIPIGKDFVRSTKELGRLEQTLKTTTPLSSPGVSPIQRITTALEEAQPIRSAQEKLYSQERKKRSAIIETIGKSKPGESGYYAQLGALKGELPKVQFKGIRDKVFQSDIDSLYNTVQSAQLSAFEKITAKNGLSKLLGEEGGLVPNQSEIDLLRQIFPPQFIQTVLNKRPYLQRIGETVSEVLNVPRALMSTFDMSAPLRQGIFMVGRPKQFLPAFGNMFKYFFNEKSYEGLLGQIKSRSTYPMMKEARLPLTDMSESLTAREEVFMSNLAEKIPLYGSVVKASNRAYSGFLNKLRADVFDDLLKKAEMQGVDIEGKYLKDLGNFIGAATGRGQLPESLEKSAVALNSLLFSPRLMASRLNLLNPNYYVSLHPQVRKEALKSLFTFAGTASTVLGLAKIGGAKVNTDPRNADFAKIKIGNTRYDVLGGFQQYLRLASQLITGEHISSTTGVKTTVGEGYKPLTRMDILGRFIESKEAPVASFVTSLLRGQGFGGDELDITEEVAKRFTPMILQDLTELYQERGIEAVGMEIPAIFGVSVQTYRPTPSEVVYSAKSVINNAKKISRYGRIEEATELMRNNKDILEMAARLEPFQKQINNLERIKNNTKKNVKISDNNKRQRLIDIDNRIQMFQSNMEAVMERVKNAPTNR